MLSWYWCFPKTMNGIKIEIMWSRMTIYFCQQVTFNFNFFQQQFLFVNDICFPWNGTYDISCIGTAKIIEIQLIIASSCDKVWKKIQVWTGCKHTTLWYRQSTSTNCAVSLIISPPLLACSRGAVRWETLGTRLLSSYLGAIIAFKQVHLFKTVTQKFAIWCK